MDRLSGGEVPAVAITGVSKRFGSTQALDDVSVAFGAGEVHALVGENGAGKSTLGKIIGGAYRADAGSLRVFGRPVHRWDPKRAQDGGVVMIAQELSLVPALSVAANVFLGREQNALGVLKPGVERRYRQIDERCGFGLPGNTPVEDLRLADRQKVEIMRAVAREARVIVMDEPSSSLTADESDRLHRVIAWLRSQGTTVVYVTHFLDAALAHCDRVSIMRDGRIVRTSATADETKESLVEAMLGAPLDVIFPDMPAGPGLDVEPLLELRDVWSADRVRGVTLSVRPGEVVGLAGLVGSGRTEIARVIFGADPADRGEIVVRGEPVRRGSPWRSVRRRMGLIPEDRRSQGLVAVRPVHENVALPHLPRFARAGVLAGRGERTAVAKLIDRVNVQPRQATGDVSVFSGGNQQKLLFAKWLLGDPEILVLDEPTRGVDIGSKHRIYALIADIARAGTAVLLISSELEEILALSHRVYLVRDGAIIGETRPQDTTVDDILFRLFGVRGSVGTTASSEPAP